MDELRGGQDAVANIEAEFKLFDRSLEESAPSLQEGVPELPEIPAFPIPPLLSLPGEVAVQKGDPVVSVLGLVAEGTKVLMKAALDLHELVEDLMARHSEVLNAEDASAEREEGSELGEAPDDAVAEEV
jgi:hypothetical protein